MDATSQNSNCKESIGTEGVPCNVLERDEIALGYQTLSSPCSSYFTR